MAKTTNQQFDELIPIVRIRSHLRSYLIWLRERRKLTQKEVALRLGITQQSYAQLEKEPWKASGDRLCRAFAALDASLAIVPKESEVFDEDLEW